MKFKIPEHPFSKKPPKALKGATKLWLHLQDELPRIGSGHRIVWAKVSRKWAKLPTVRFNQLSSRSI